MKDKIFDNSNIAESYAGVTTPLTFSFVRYVYQEVYPHFCKMMGVNDKTIKENKDMFEHMVEFIGYRIYYNLGNWYKMLSFFPGYKFSSRFMEKMMGVEKEFYNTESYKHNLLQKYLIYLPKAIFYTLRISLSFLFLGTSIKKFNKYFDQIFLKINSTDLKQLSLKELKGLYVELDNKLLSRWRIPIANDFAVMVSAGLADMLFKQWLNSNEAYSYMKPKTNRPLVSLDPGNKIKQIVEEIRKDQEIYGLFEASNEKEVLNLLNSQYPTHQVTQKIDNYLREFGSKVPNELKLESETLIENPEIFITLLKNTIGNSKGIPTQSDNVSFRQSSLAELPVIKMVFLKWLLRWAGNSIQRREDARFRRTLIFGYARKIFLEIGRKMEQKKILKNDRDIFYLTTREIFDIVDDKKLDTDLVSIIEQRKLEFTKWQNVELPRRIETPQSISEIEHELLNQPVINRERDTDKLIGRVASCPNGMQTFSGVALTLKDFDPMANFEGKILVTCQTDPGWTIIFPLLAGVVVERGGMLSHAAIVARELNIPCIVGVQQATDVISSGMKIALDLQDGLIHKI